MSENVERWIAPAREASAELAAAFGYEGWCASDDEMPVDGDVRGGLIAIVGDEVLLQVALLADHATARALAAGMLQMEDAELDDALVADSLCELANVMAGSLKSRASTEGLHLRLGLPVHVAGQVDPPAGASHLVLGHRWQGRSITVLLIERASGH